MPKPMGNVVPPMLNARAIFDRLDTNKDGKLSFEEFAVGVRHLQAFLAARIGEMKMPLQRGMQFAARKSANSKAHLATRHGTGGTDGPMGMHPGMGPAGPMGPMACTPAWDRRDRWHQWACTPAWDRWAASTR